MKSSLVKANKALPASIGDVKPGALLPGYVASVTSDAVFVRFLGTLTGRAGECCYPLMPQVQCSDY